MGLFHKPFVFVFAHTVHDGETKYIIEGYLKSSKHILQANGKMDLDLINSIVKKGEAKYPRIWSSSEGHNVLLFGENINGIVKIYELIVVEDTSTGRQYGRVEKNVNAEFGIKIEMKILQRFFDKHSQI